MAKLSKKERRFWECHHNIKKLADIPESVERLFYRDSEITNEELSFVAQRVKMVERLELDSTSITNVAIKNILGFEGVKELRLKGADGITDEAVSDLAKITGLEFLHLGGTSVTLKGALGLAGSNTLQRVILSKGDASENDILKLKVALGSCKVDINP